MRFTHLVQVVKRGDFFHQTLGWSLQDNWAGAQSDVTALVQSLRLNTEREPVIGTSQGPFSDFASNWKLISMRTHVRATAFV